jgi:hypothetical protein
MISSTNPISHPTELLKVHAFERILPIPARLGVFGLWIALSVLFASPGFTQISIGGTPLKSGISAGEIEWINLEDVRVEHLLLEDEWATLTGKKNQRIAQEVPVSIRPEQLGNWSQSTNGTLIWRLGIRGQGAKALGIVFDRYALEPGSRIYIYDPSATEILGAFTSRNNKASGYLAVSYLPGDELIIQMEVDPGSGDYGEWQIGSVRWAYLPVFDEKSGLDQYFGSSGECNVDINCSIGDDWQLVKHSVVRMLNIEKCTGLLVNNVKQDGKLYIYTAAHCVFQNNKYQPTVFYFDYESPECDGSDGITTKSISGATLIATGDTLENPRDSDSLDFALLELSAAVPESYKPYFAGWNRSKTPAQNSVAIHHPGGDVKKISVDNDPPEVSYHDIDFFPELIRYSHWRILEWDVATTEPGSSGCPIFNQNQQLVGTLTGGQATCSFRKNDYFTRFDYAWDYYPEPWKQVKHWLDPDNTGVMSLAGKAGWPVSVGQLKSTGGINLYPNPARELLNITSLIPVGKSTLARIYNPAGKLILQESLDWTGRAEFDIRALPPGIYLLQLRQDDRVESGRFIISR